MTDNKKVIREMIADVNGDSISSAKQKFNVLMAKKIQIVLEKKKKEFSKSFFGTKKES